jgi:hypothetical protein
MLEINKDIVPLDSIASKWLISMWKEIAPVKWKQFLQDLEFSIDWSGVSITQDEVKYFNKQTQPKSKSQTVFRTEFENHTKFEQEYSFTSERITKQTCLFKFSKSFTIENDNTIRFKVPASLLEIGGGFKSEYSVEFGKDETKEEQVTWAIDSKVRVAPNRRTIASVSIKEVELDKDFAVETRISGHFTFTFNKKGNRNEKVLKIPSVDIAHVLFDAWNKKLFPTDSPAFKFVIRGVSEVSYAKWILSGSCQFRFSVEQQVHLKNEILSEESEGLMRKDSQSTLIL